MSLSICLVERDLERFFAREDRITAEIEATNAVLEEQMPGAVKALMANTEFVHEALSECFENERTSLMQGLALGDDAQVGRAIRTIVVAYVQQHADAIADGDSRFSDLNAVVAWWSKS